MTNQPIIYATLRGLGVARGGRNRLKSGAPLLPLLAILKDFEFWLGNNIGGQIVGATIYNPKGYIS
jgi:hypothetical protein